MLPPVHRLAIVDGVDLNLLDHHCGLVVAEKLPYEIVGGDALFVHSCRRHALDEGEGLASNDGIANHGRKIV